MDLWVMHGSAVVLWPSFWLLWAGIMRRGIVPELDAAEEAAVREWLRQQRPRTRRWRTPPRQLVRPTSALDYERPYTPEHDAPSSPGDERAGLESPPRGGRRNALRLGRRVARRARAKARSAARASSGGCRNTGLLWRRLCSAIPRGHGQLQSTLLRRLRLPLAAFQQLVAIKDQHGTPFFGQAAYGGSPFVYRPPAGEALPRLQHVIFQGRAPPSIFAPR